MRLRNPLDPGSVNLLAGFSIYSAVPRAWLWVSYRLQGRKDWRVVIRPLVVDSNREAALDERLPTKELAALRAAELLLAVRGGSWVPGGPSSESSS